MAEDAGTKHLAHTMGTNVRSQQRSGCHLASKQQQADQEPSSKGQRTDPVADALSGPHTRQRGNYG